MLFDVVVYILFILLCVYGIHKDKKIDKEAYIKKLNALRGIFAIEIVMGHVVRYENNLLYPLGKFMIISVAFFFFVSGYGLIYSWQTKENYLQGFVVRKPVFLLLLIILVRLFDVIIDIVLPVNLGYYDFWINGDINFTTLVVDSSNGLWFLFELIIFYILFYLIFTFIKNKRALILGAVIFIMITVAYFTDFSEAWYASAMSFALGVLFGEYFDAIVPMLKKWWIWPIAVLLSVVGGGCLLMKENLVSMVYLRNIMCIAGILITLLIVTRFNIENRITYFLGKFSTEIYLYQFAYLKITEVCNWDYRLRMIFVITSTLVTAVVMKNLTGLIRQGCFRLSKVRINQK